MTEECIHGLDPAWCAYCLKHKLAEEQEDDDFLQHLRDLK